MVPERREQMAARPMSDPGSEDSNEKVDAALSRAVHQLETAVREQETAADRILALAERIYDKAPDKATRLQVEAIMEACAFQDLTGQRIRKVTRLIRYLQENKLTSTADLPPDAPTQPDHDGLTQKQVDQLLSGRKTGTG
jgi:chemotaxis regulatin CheY-phosphate phosphatase CheZ